MLNILNRYNEVLAAVESLKHRVAALADPPGSDEVEVVDTWVVRELLFDAGREAAYHLHEWQTGLDFTKEILKSMRQRDAPEVEQARELLNLNPALLNLGLFDEARSRLYHCRSVFEHELDVKNLGKTLSSLADLEGRAGNLTLARHFHEAALRYAYVAADLKSITLQHSQLADYILREAQGIPEEVLGKALAHHVAALLLSAMTEYHRQIVPRRLAEACEYFGPAQVRIRIPADYATLCATVSEVEGVRFREVFDRLAAHRATTGDEILKDETRGFFDWIGMWISARLAGTDNIIEYMFSQARSLQDDTT